MFYPKIPKGRVNSNIEFFTSLPVNFKNKQFYNINNQITATCSSVLLMYKTKIFGKRLHVKVHIQETIAINNILESCNFKLHNKYAIHTIEFENGMRHTSTKTTTLYYYYKKCFDSIKEFLGKNSLIA